MLRGELTNLRSVERSDGETLHAWLDDPEIMRWWGRGVAVVSRNLVQQEIERWLDEERTREHPVAFVIETLDHEAIGLILLSDMEPVDRSAELSILLTEAHRRHGFGSDALATLIDAAVDQWGLHRLTARSEAANAAAHSFFEKSGFRLEGRLREARFVDGGWDDILIFGYLRGWEDER